MANYWTSFSVLFPVGAGNVGAALALYAQFEAELEAGDETIGFTAAEDEPGSGTLWLWDGGSGDPEHVITYAIRCAEAFSLTGRWGFRWSLCCSKPRLDGAGGGAQVLDLGQRKSIDWVDTEHWLSEQLGRAETRTVPAGTILQTAAEAQGWNDHSQLSVLLGFLDGLIADDPAVADRLRAHVAAVSKVEEDFTCRECGAEVFVSDAGTTHHVGTGMDGIDYARDLAETRSAAKCGAFARCGCNHTALPEKEP